jgi:hypothetical protein
VESISDYELQWKLIEQTWSDASTNAVISNAKKKCKAEAIDLNPGMTYCVRLVCVELGSKGAPGPELIIDTEQVGCAPKSSSCACLIQ